MILIMLDFDGVTHPLDRSISAASSMDKRCLKALEQAFLPYQNLKIIVCSSWRMEKPLGTIKAMLGDYLGSRVIGITSSIEILIKDFNKGGSRGKECRAWIEQNQVGGVPVVAIDDKPEMYDSICDKLR